MQLNVLIFQHVQHFLSAHWAWDEIFNQQFEVDFHLAETIFWQFQVCAGFGRANVSGDLVSWCDGLSLCWLVRHLLRGWRRKDEPNKEKIFCVCACVPVHMCISFQTKNNHSSPLLNLWLLSFSFFLGLLASSKREISLPLTRIKKLPEDFNTFLVLRFVIKIYNLPQSVTIYVKDLCLKNLRVVFWILIMIL